MLEILVFYISLAIGWSLVTVGCIYGIAMILMNINNK